MFEYSYQAVWQLHLQASDHLLCLIGTRCGSRTPIPSPKLGVLPLHYILCMELPEGIEPSLSGYKSLVLPLNYGSVWAVLKPVCTRSVNRLNRLSGLPNSPLCVVTPMCATPYGHFPQSPMVLPVGLEPTTPRLKILYSTN